MLINRGIERARQLGAGIRYLKQRAQSVQDRNPLILIPPVMATRLVDHSGRAVWGPTKRLWWGPAVGSAQGVHSAGLLREFEIIPFLLGHDVFGGMIRFLERIGGYCLGEDLFHLDYDWRGSTADGAGALGELVDRLRGHSDQKIDLLCVSSGGVVARYFLADVESRSAGEPAQDLIRRVIYVGSPQRGSFSAFANVHDGITVAPRGKHFDRQEVGSCQITYDCLPHPEERVFIDESGRSLDHDIYDARVWRDFELGDYDRRDLQVRLDAGRKVHEHLAQTRSHPDAIIIGADNQTTPHRIVISRGKAFITDCCSISRNPAGQQAYVRGDGAVPFSSLCLPGTDESQIWKVRPRDHHLIAMDLGVHKYVLEGLLATDRVIPAFDLSPTVQAATLMSHQARRR